jgi:hypothetical protein
MAKAPTPAKKAANGLRPSESTSKSQSRELFSSAM